MNVRSAATLIISIIIVAAIAAGLAIYDMKTGNLSKSFYEKAQEMDPIYVIRAMIAQGANKQMLSITVQNMRNDTIIFLTAEMQGEGVMNFYLEKYGRDCKVSEQAPLQPYEKAALFERLTGTYEASKSYDVTIRAVYANGTTYTKTIKVSCFD